MITFFNPFNLFQAPFIALLNCYSFWDYDSTSLVGAKIIINLKSMWITVVLYNFPDVIVKLIKMFSFKFGKIYLNRDPETPVLKIASCILIEPI